MKLINKIIYDWNNLNKDGAKTRLSVLALMVGMNIGLVGWISCDIIKLVFFA